MFDGPHSPRTFRGIQGQLDLFQHAKIVLGPHGAGLTNMLWCQNGTSIIEFPLVPHTNRNLGFLAMATEMDYWLLPQIHANYYLKYEIDQAGVDAAVRLLRHIIDARGLTHLYAPGREEL